MPSTDPAPSQHAKTSRRRRIGLLCLSAIPDDPRVRRQGDIMQAAGWDVLAIGLPGHRSPPPSWLSLEVGRHEPSSAARLRGATAAAAPGAPRPPGLRERLSDFWDNHPSTAMVQARRLATRVEAAYRIGRIHAQPAYAGVAYWCANPHFGAIHDLARNHSVDLWLANDWTTLPIAARLSSEQGVPYAYDTHEFAAEEYAHSLRWRLLHRKLTVGVEGRTIRDAAFVTCVSDGIADRLADFYRLSRRPTVVRNTPNYEAVSFRPTGQRISALYHGAVSPGRGLEACIESAQQWRPEFQLAIRGPSSESYLASLVALAQRYDVADRIEFLPAVPMTELVRSAAQADIGLFALPSHSLHNVNALPNKFFEYTMAGLALCVSDLPEMSRLLRQHDLGVLIESPDPAAIAAAINSLTPNRIDQFKGNALAAAKTLNWSAEGQKLVALCDEVAPEIDTRPDQLIR